MIIRLSKCRQVYTDLGHDRAQIEVVRLRDDPVRVAGQRPAGDGAHQRLALGQAAHQVRDQVRQVRHHAAHAAVRHRAQRQDAALLYDKHHTMLNTNRRFSRRTHLKKLRLCREHSTVQIRSRGALIIAGTMK